MIHPNGPRTGRPPVIASRGMVSTPHYLASASGLDALRRGGSAVDAMIAANATLCVVYPHMTGLGGDGFWLIAGPDTGGVQALDASGPAGRKATRDYFRKHGCTDQIPARGPLAALTTPGAVDGWRAAHERHGKLQWASLFADAIEYARNGIAITRSLADWLAADESILQQFPDTARIFLPETKVQREGSGLVQTRLAHTFEQLAESGARAAYYEGPIAKSICAALAPAGSPLSPEDFTSYKAQWVKPISTTYRGYEVFQMPPSTQGFSALQILNLLEGFDVSTWGDGTADYYHHMVEAVKVAFADRDEWLTDPEFVQIPLDQLLSKDYASARRKLINAKRALVSDQIKAGVPYGARSDRRSPGGDTVYSCACDASGLVVSNIQSIYHDFGSAVIAGDTGIVMQNRGSFFSLDDKHPNRLEPGKRTFHTIIPAMMLRDGEPVLAFGTMGGEGQPQTQAALLTRLIDFGYDVQQAIEAPRWLMGRTWGMESHDLWLEPGINAETVRELRLRGQPVKMAGPWDGTLGHAQAIRIDRKSRLFEGGADPRGDGAAMGY
ncbi:gamma-glutamyltransferase [Oligoflexus tunisiensis]|uniref:gamma-glutamyltransferase n=1 Tax=Oligoflexus tunisiensis TaxID=708132 RepID=UPI000A79DAE0|nr:gamma-glutamyltransferase [Oligoflexus tunisiensis]